MFWNNWCNKCLGLNCWNWISHYLLMCLCRSWHSVLAIGGFHVTWSPPCWWKLDLSLACFVRALVSICSFHHCCLSLETDWKPAVQYQIIACPLKLLLHVDSNYLQLTDSNGKDFCTAPISITHASLGFQ